MQSYKITLSIIIVNYRSEEYLRGCLASIFEKFKGISYEIFIVNNDEKPVLETHFNASLKENVNIKIINHGKNIGFGAGINLGAKEAAGRYLLFLNPDTEILTNDFGKILEKFEKNLEIGVIGPRLVTENGKTQWWCAGKEFSFWQLVKNNFSIIESKKVWESEKEIFADWVSGGAMFVRADIFRKISGFDERFFMYAEDVDLCKRIRTARHKILFSPEFTIKHFCGKSAQNKISQKKQFFLSMIKYFLKYV